MQPAINETNIIENTQLSTVAVNTHAEAEEDKQESQLAYQSRMEKYISSLSLKTKTKDELLKEAIYILKHRIKDYEPTALELEALQLATRHIEFFQLMNQKESNVALNLHQKCCRSMEYLFKPKGSIIFRKGDSGDRIYIILSGSVNVFDEKPPEQIEKEKNFISNIETKLKEKTDGKETRRGAVLVSNDPDTMVSRKVANGVQIHKQTYDIKKARRDLFKAVDDSDSSDEEDKNKSLSNSMNDSDQTDGCVTDSEGSEMNMILFNALGRIDPKYIKDVNTFFTDGIFNQNYESTMEKELIFGELGLLKGKSRQRTIICKEDSEFGTISKRDYFEIKNLIKEKRRRDMTNFIELNIFPELPRDAVSRVVEILKKLKMNKGQKIYQEKDKPDKLFIIRKGEVTLYTRRSKLVPITDDSMRGKLENLKNLFHKPIPENSKLIPVTTLAEGQYFGDEDLLENKLRTFTAICTSLNVKFHTISRTELMRCFQEYPFLRTIMFKKLWLKTNQRQYQQNLRNDILLKARQYQIDGFKTQEQQTTLREEVIQFPNKTVSKPDKPTLINSYEDMTKKTQKIESDAFASNQFFSTQNALETSKNYDSKVEAKHEESSPGRARLARHASVDSIFEYAKPRSTTNLPAMDYSCYGQDQDSRKLLLRGVRSDLAALKKGHEDEEDLSRITRMIKLNEKTSYQLCKNAPPANEVFSILKEFTTHANENREKRFQKMLEQQSRLQTSVQLPKISQTETGNMHVEAKRMKKYHAGMISHRDFSGLLDMSSMIIPVPIASKQREDQGDDKILHDSIMYAKKEQLNLSSCEDSPTVKLAKSGSINKLKSLEDKSTLKNDSKSSRQEFKLVSKIEIRRSNTEREPTKINLSLGLKPEDSSRFNSIDNALSSSEQNNSPISTLRFNKLALTHGGNRNHRSKSTSILMRKKDIGNFAGEEGNFTARKGSLPKLRPPLTNHI